MRHPGREVLVRMALGSLLVGGLVSLPRPADAGALGAVLGGLARASGHSDRGDRRGSGNDRSGSSGGDSSGWHWESMPGPPRHPTDVYLVGESPPPPPGMRTSLSVYAGAQSVDASDGALVIDVRAGATDFGVGVRTTQYFERQDPGEPTLKLDLWTLDIAWRVLGGDAPLSIWVEAGPSGLTGSGDLGLAGAQGGLRLERMLGGELRAGLQAKLFWLQDNVFASEACVSLQAWIVRVSYRYLDFNVGPPLKGPELGLALSF